MASCEAALALIASEMASRHQPMNWRDSIWVQTRSRSGRSRCVKLRSVEFPMKENIAEHSPPHSSLKGEKRRKGKNATTFFEIFSEHLVLTSQFLLICFSIEVIQ